MAIDRFMIAPLNDGLRTDLKAWQIPDESYAKLENAYIFRGRLKKRIGSKYTGTGTGVTANLKSRVRMSLPYTRVTLTGAGVGITDGAGAATGTPPGGVYAIGQQFSIGTEVFTVVATGIPGVLRTTGSSTTHTYNTTSGVYVFAGAAPTTQIYFYPDGLGHGAQVAGVVSGILPGAKFGIGQQFSIGSEILTIPSLGASVTLTTTGTYSGTVNTTTGAYSFSGLSASPVIYYYPAEPIMGLNQYEKGTVHNQTAYAFDTQFAYKYSGGSWVRDSYNIFNGANYNFVWSYNWDGIQSSDTCLFVTNFNVNPVTSSPNGDPMYFYDGTTWQIFRPQFITSGTTNANKIQTAKIIIPFKNRLLLLNTIESDSAGTANLAYTNRCRYSQNGSPVVADAFQEPNQASWLGGGYIDGPTEEDITGAELIRDRCIVYFERSTWELAYTGNEAIPFIWQQVNTELGSEAQFSNVPFDKFILNVGSTGIQSCNGINVDRIDDKIPDEVFNIRINNQGMSRVAGVRDYYTEMVYWTYPTDDNPHASIYPNKMFVFNYKNGTWAINDDCITAFGYFEQQNDITWADIQGTWEDNNQSWTSNVNAAQFRNVIAGNQHGFITILERGTSSQVGTLSVSTVTYTAGTQSVALYVKDHSLAPNDFIKLENMNGTTLANIYKIYDVTDDNTIVLNGILVDPGTYTGGGIIARVPKLDILSKEWNPYKKDNRNFHLLKVDFGVKNTSAGQVTIDCYPSHSEDSLGTSILETTPYTLVPLETLQRLLWHAIYFQGEGDSVQIRISLSDEQMLTKAIVESDFTLEGLILYTQPTRVR
jgi:hypothetical protein